MKWAIFSKGEENGSESLRCYAFFDRNAIVFCKKVFHEIICFETRRLGLLEEKTAFEKNPLSLTESSTVLRSSAVFFRVRQRRKQ